MPPSARLMTLITGHWATAAVHAAAKLGVADVLQAGPRSSAEVAEAVGAHEPSLFRLLRALASMGVVRETAPRTFGLTEVGDLLRVDHPFSGRCFALFQGADPHWRGWGSFLHAVQTGESAFEAAHGKKFFEYLEEDDSFSQVFNDAMTTTSRWAVDALVKLYEFGALSGTLVDVGGGQGRLLAGILAAHPELLGVLFDLPHVVAEAGPHLEEAGVAGRCQVEGGDFFAGLPAAETYLARHIIHDWGDDDCVRILKNMAAAMRGGGRVLLLETVIPPGDQPHFGKLLDLEMLTCTHGGRERTEVEFAELFERAGLRLERIIPAEGSAVIEGVPA